MKRIPKCKSEYQGGVSVQPETPLFYIRYKLGHSQGKTNKRFAISSPIKRWGLETKRTIATKVGVSEASPNENINGPGKKDSGISARAVIN